MKIEIYDLKLYSRCSTNLCLWNEEYEWIDRARLVKTKDFSFCFKRILSTFDLPDTGIRFFRKTIKMCKEPTNERLTKFFVASCDLWLPVFDLVELADRVDLLPVSEPVMAPLKAAFGIALSVISIRDIPRQIKMLCAQNSKLADRFIAFFNLVADVAHTALGALFFVTSLFISLPSMMILITVIICVFPELSLWLPGLMAK
jgi:hypothetical protein